MSEPAPSIPPSAESVRRQTIAAIHTAAMAELHRIHGPKSADYVLGYQRCAKVIIEAVEGI